MRVCQCGGHIRQHELTGNREAWTCGACGRYGVIVRGKAESESLDLLEILDEKDCACIQQPGYNGGVNVLAHTDNDL
jgi:hypothetical protein